MYPRLPEIIPRQPQAETLEQFGLRVFAFVIEHGITATLSVEQLELADHFYPIAVATPDLMPATIDHYAKARRMILQTLRWRAVEAQAIQEAKAAAASQQAPAPAQAHQDDGRGPGGDRQPVAPRPNTRPPSGDAIALKMPAAAF